MENDQKDRNSSIIENEKLAWSTPILTELNIQSETKFNIMGPSISDGGDSFNDYTS